MERNRDSSVALAHQEDHWWKVAWLGDRKDLGQDHRLHLELEDGDLEGLADRKDPGQDHQDSRLHLDHWDA
jgi:hypothetical protein